LTFVKLTTGIMKKNKNLAEWKILPGVL